MSPSRARTAAVIAVYWLLLVCGLLVYTSIRIAAAELVIPIWLGAIGGTVLGQVFALRRARLWVPIAAAVATVMLFSSSLSRHDTSEHTMVTLWLSFVPAVVCGYWSLGDRSSLAAFWFPAMIWMLSILDHSTASGIVDRSGVVLLCTLVVGFGLFLRVRESRRVDLWRTIATTPLATTHAPTVLAENPTHRLVHTGWTVAAVALTAVATVWAAPRLWQNEAFDKNVQHVELVGLPCCPAPEDVATLPRVKEYLDIGRVQDQHDDPPSTCRQCVDPAVAFTDTALEPGPDVVTGPKVGGDSDDFGAGLTNTLGSAAGTTTTTTTTPVATPSVPGNTVAPPAPAPASAVNMATAPGVPAIAHPPVSPATPPSPRPVLPEAHGTATAPIGSHVHADPPSVSTRAPAILRWVAVLVAALLVFPLMVLALRPLRRLVTLRHLRRPYWAETVDQRISNSWQLVLIGLRDAGWRSIESEAPRAFAHRVRVEGVESCATILERARHGIRIDAGDLAEMSQSAETAYRSARSHIGVVARAASWLRRPIA